MLGKKKEPRVFKKDRKKKNQIAVDAAPIRNFPEIFAGIQKKNFRFIAKKSEIRLNLLDFHSSNIV